MQFIKLNWTYFIFFIFCFPLQSQILYEFDLINNTKDSFPVIQNVDGNLSENTSYYLGDFSNILVNLADTIPTTNVYPESQFSIRTMANTDYDLNVFPIRTSAQLRRVEDGIWEPWCSGSMVSKRHYLTAAHCLSSSGSNALYADSLFVCPVFDQGLPNANFGCSRVLKVYLLKDYMPIDLALLMLEDPIGEQTGWLSFGFNQEDSFFTEGIYYKFSYPSTYFPVLDTTFYDGNDLFYNYGKLDLITENHLAISNTSGIPGESGSSIILVENNTNYTTYGVGSFSLNYRHARIPDYLFYSFKDLIKNDVLLSNEFPMSKNHVRIFPNPVKHSFQLDFLPKEEITRILIIDLLGREVMNLPIKTNAPYNIEMLTKGIYFVNIQSVSSQVSLKLFKE